MITFKESVKTFWNYYLELESEFVQTKKYVEFSKDNYGAYSVEFLKLYQAICSEIDVLGKYIASQINPSFSRTDNKTINQWWIEIQDYSYFYLNIGKYEDPSTSPILLGDARIHNYLISEDYQPWNNYRVERYVDIRGNNRLRCQGSAKVPS